MVSVKQNNLSRLIKLNEDGEDIPSDENLENEAHNLCATADNHNGDIYLTFSSRLALYDFARSLMHEAVFNSGDTTEFFPLGKH